MGSLYSLSDQARASEKVLKLLELAGSVYESWTSEKFDDGDTRDREPIIGIAQMLQQELNEERVE